MNSALKKELDFFLENQAQLIADHPDKCIVIKDQQVVGVHDNEAEAVAEASKKYELGTFLIQRCGTGKDSITQVFHTRVARA